MIGQKVFLETSCLVSSLTASTIYEATNRDQTAIFYIFIFMFLFVFSIRHWIFFIYVLIVGMGSQWNMPTLHTSTFTFCLFQHSRCHTSRLLMFSSLFLSFSCLVLSWSTSLSSFITRKNSKSKKMKKRELKLRWCL